MFATVQYWQNHLLKQAYYFYANVFMTQEEYREGARDRE